MHYLGFEFHFKVYSRVQRVIHIPVRQSISIQSSVEESCLIFLQMVLFVLYVYVISCYTRGSRLEMKCCRLFSSVSAFVGVREQALWKHEISQKLADLMFVFVGRLPLVCYNCLKM